MVKKFLKSINSFSFKRVFSLVCAVLVISLTFVPLFSLSASAAEVSYWDSARDTFRTENAFDFNIEFDELASNARSYNVTVNYRQYGSSAQSVLDSYDELMGSFNFSYGDSSSLDSRYPNFYMADEKSGLYTAYYTVEIVLQQDVYVQEFDSNNQLVRTIDTNLAGNAFIITNYGYSYSVGCTSQSITEPRTFTLYFGATNSMFEVDYSSVQLALKPVLNFGSSGLFVPESPTFNIINTTYNGYDFSMRTFDNKLIFGYTNGVDFLDVYDLTNSIRSPNFNEYRYIECTSSKLLQIDYNEWLFQNADSYDELYQNAFDDGYQLGFDDGYEEGYQDGSSQQIEDVWNEAYYRGYNAGVSESVIGDITNPVGALFDFEIGLGISIGHIVITVIGISLLLAFLKYFAGG